MGIFDIFKKSRKQINRENQEQGKAGEEQIKNKWKSYGYDVERTGKGHDWKATKKDFWTGKKETKYIEVKTGNSELSDLQKKKKRQMGKKYVVERLEPTIFGLSSTEPDLKKKKRASKKSNDSLFGSSSSVDSFFGSSSKKKKRKSNDWGF